ncbi:MAG: gluconate 2-dehydrogenase subunit 3 family protein, partial [Woeseiaceae bacterium]
GYGTDIDLMNPTVPWPRTMTDAQLRSASALCDLIVPEDERSPAASAVGVPDFIDEWVSAPYPAQQSDRELILDGLEWVERQSRERFGSGFAGTPDHQKSELLDRIAYPGGASSDLARQVEFFERFRFLTVGAFYTTEEGMKDVGYIGNVAIHGEYPGPSNEAMTHLAGVLEQLGLQLPA